jgi:hypothetical protein
MVVGYGLPKESRSSLALGKAGKLRERLGGESSVTRVKRPSGKLWPNGEYSVGWAYETDGTPVGPESEFGFMRNLGVEAEPLTLSLPPNPHKTPKPSPKKKYGLNGITGYGRKMVRNGAFILERRLGRRNMGFLTLTVPALGREALETLAKNWSEVVRQTAQYLTRALKARKVSTGIVFCTELQEARIESRGECVYHLHILMQSRTPAGQWIVDISCLRTWFSALIERVSGEAFEGVCRCKAEVVKHSAEGYIGKYMSKGVRSAALVVKQYGENAVPGSWWGMSKNLRREVKKATNVGREAGSEVLDGVERLLASGSEVLILSVRPVFIDFDDRPVLMGFCGRFDAGESARVRGRISKRLSRGGVIESA